MAFRSSALRDVLLLVAVFGALLGGLFLYTGVWPPAVIVESGSMMHEDAEVTYGRVGTIDPGDLVLVKLVSRPEDVETLLMGGTERYGKPGDVIVYYPGNLRDRVPIIHRAVAYVEPAPEGAAGRYRLLWPEGRDCVGGAVRDGPWCAYDENGIQVPEVPISSFKPTRAGFVTKGDNPATNRETDQSTGLCCLGGRDAIPLEWIGGKARAELPWLGLIKLSLSGRYNQPECSGGVDKFHFFDASPTGRCAGWVAFGRAYAPRDLWVMLAISLFLLVGVPLLYDLYRTVRERQERRQPPPPDQQP